MKGHCIQSEDFCLEDIKTPEQLRKFLFESGKMLTEMVNKVLGTYKESDPLQKVEVGFFVILDKKHNPRGSLGFWDVSETTNAPSTPETLKWP